MQKKRKTIFTAVITALFVLSVGYFAMLAPTTAWYYQESALDYNYTFKFRNFSESFSETIGEATVPLRAATRFADGGEWLFDEVMYVLPLTTTNTSASELDGIVHVNVTSVPTGVRWYAFGSDTALGAVSTLTNGSKGQYKPKIETMLGDFGLTVRNFKDLGESNYAAYNTKATAALGASQAEGILVPTNTTKYIYVVFWAEYGDVKSSLQSTSVSTPINGTATVTVTAEPYVGKYSTKEQTLQVTNTTDSAVNVTVTVAGEASARTLPVPASGTQATIIPSDSQLRVQAPSGKTFTISAGLGGVLTGNTENVCAIAEMTSDFNLSIADAS